jgi:hypothetical protein
MAVVLHPPYFYPYPRLKIKLKGRYTDTTEVIEAESQTVLNTLAEHDFQDALKKGRNVGNGEYTRKGTTSRVMLASRPKASFVQMAAPVQQIMNGTLYFRACGGRDVTYSFLEDHYRVPPSLPPEYSC